MKSPTFKKIGIGLVGLGTVGSAVARILQSQGSAIREKTGVELVLRRVCVRHLNKKRASALSRRLLTGDARKLLKDPSIDILVELIGGLSPARQILEGAIASGKHVVTANKALLAEQGGRVFGFAARHGKKIGFEASVCGGIPIIKSIREGLAANDISQFLGIVNGTCNFILTSMSEKGLTFGEALKQAQAKGYAEKNSDLDTQGIDSAHKLAILARLSFGAEVPFKKVSIEGIKSLTADDIAYAKELGYAIKLLAIGKKSPKGLELRVHPTLLPVDHPLSNVKGVYNAVFVHGDRAGDILFYGRGAGAWPTASAVLSDILDIAQNRDSRPFSPKMRALPVMKIDDIVSKYYLRFQVADKPGVLGRIAQTLGKNNISILSVHQKESHDPRSVPVIILTYEAREKDLRKALRQIDSEKEVSRKTTVIRVEK